MRRFQPKIRSAYCYFASSQPLANPCVLGGNNENLTVASYKLEIICFQHERDINQSITKVHAPSKQASQSRNHYRNAQEQSPQPSHLHISWESVPNQTRQELSFPKAPITEPMCTAQVTRLPITYIPQLTFAHHLEDPSMQ